MSKILVKENYRVTVEIDDWYFHSIKDLAKKHEIAMKDCGTIVSDIKRHVDGFSSVSIEYDNNPVCEHCGAAWTEDSNYYNGGCCRKDSENDSGFVWSKNNDYNYDPLNLHLTIPFSYGILGL